MLTLTRNGRTLWVAVATTIVGYLLSVGTPPTQWSYRQWLQALAALAAWGAGKLQSSPLPSNAEAAVTAARKDLP